MIHPPDNPHARALYDAMTTTPGATSAELRQRAAARASAGPSVSLGSDAGELEAFVDAVARDPRAADVASLLGRGHSEDVVFELAIAAALGAGFSRVEGALTTLRGLKK